MYCDALLYPANKDVVAPRFPWGLSAALREILPVTLNAAIQTTYGDEIEHNLEAVAEYVEPAAAGGAELVVLPECFALMPKNSRQLCACAEGGGEGKIQGFIEQLARRAKVWIIPGTPPLRRDAPGRVLNSLLA